MLARIIDKLFSVCYYGVNPIPNADIKGGNDMKKILILLLVTLMALTLLACNKVELHCDGCGKAVYGDAKMDESWIIFCEDCEPDIDMD